MQDISSFESRRVELSCTVEEFYRFITDIRNFGNFIPPDVIRNWHATEESCTFSISTIGEVNLGISSKSPSLVVFAGKVLGTTEFDLKTDISQSSRGNASVVLRMNAGLSPLLRMMASGPIESFLSTIADEMENFRNWNG